MTNYVNPVTRVGGVDQVVVAERPTAIPVDDAPFDDEQYVRVNGEWVPYTAPPIIPDTLAPKPPTGLSGAGVMAGSGTRVDYTLTWSAPTQNTDNSPLDDFAYYVLRWRYAGLTAWSTLTTNDTTYLLPSLLPAVNIQWEVLARDTSGNDSTWASNTVTGTTDTDPPLTPTTPVLGSRLGSIVISWDGLLAGASAPPADFAYLEVFMSATTGGPWTPIGRLNSAGAVVVASLAVGSQRFFTFVATDTSGNDSPRSAEADIVVLGVQGPDIEANAITANMIATGELSAALTITGYLLAGNPAGSRVVIDGEGIRQYGDTGELLTNIPTEAGAPATFEGSVIADSMIIKDYLSLQGLANKVARGAVLTLEGGTSAPALAPSVAVGYETWDPNRWSYLFVPTGAHSNADDDGSQLIGALTFFGYGTIFGESDKQWQGPGWTDSGGTGRTKYGNIGATTAVAVGGAERLIVNGIYMPSNGAAPLARIVSLDHNAMATDGSIEPPLKAIRDTTLPNWAAYIQLGRVFGGLSGTQYPERIAMALQKMNGATFDDTKITLRQYTVTDNATLNSGFTLVSGTEKVVTTPLVTDEGLIGVTHGRVDKLFPGPLAAGVASTDYIWLIHGSVNTYAYLTTGGALTRVPDYDFPTPPGASRMMAWGDLATNQFLGFRTLEWSPTSDVTKLTNNHWVGATSSKWWASTTNFDADITGSTHESPQGPRASVTMKKRAGLLVTVPPYPVRPSPTTTDDPLSAKIYIARGGSDPGRTYMEYAGQTDDPNRSLLIGDFTFPTGLAAVPPPALGDFPSSSPSKVVPGETANWFLAGDGSATIGGLVVAVDGTVTLTAHDVAVGNYAQTNQRVHRFRKKNNSSAVQHEVRQYAFDGGFVTAVFQDAVEQYRTELNQATGLRMLRASDSAESVYRADGVTSARMRTTEFVSDLTTTTTTSTTGAAMGTAGAQGTFVAPPSGIVEITVNAQVKAATAGQPAACSFEVKTGSTIGSGTVVLAHSIDRSAMNANAQYVRSSASYLVSGLTAGATYNTRTVMMTSVGTSTATFGHVRMMLRYVT